MRNIRMPVLVVAAGSGAVTVAAALLPGISFQADGFGSDSMRDRPASAGGGLRISSVPGRGTKVEVRL